MIDSEKSSPACFWQKIDLGYLKDISGAAASQDTARRCGAEPMKFESTFFLFFAAIVTSILEIVCKMSQSHTTQSLQQFTARAGGAEDKAVICALGGES